jgi:hypothetical protein
VTALVVQDLLGGELIRCETSMGSHYFNRFEDGSELDLTREQFTGELEASRQEVRTREYVLGFEATRRRYELLRDRAARS